ncbi:unnamed protein product [Heterosigma akashiwo]
MSLSHLLLGLLVIPALLCSGFQLSNPTLKSIVVKTPSVQLKANNDEGLPEKIDWDAELSKLQKGQIDTNKVPKGIDGMNNLEVQAVKTKSKVDKALGELPKVDLPKMEMPKVEMPKVEMPKMNLPNLPGGIPASPPPKKYVKGLYVKEFYSKKKGPQELYRRPTKKQALKVPSMQTLYGKWQFWVAVIFGLSAISAIITVSTREELIVYGNEQGLNDLISQIQVLGLFLMSG